MRRRLIVAAYLVLACFTAAEGRNACNKRFYGTDAFGCVCNAQYCDDIEPLGTIQQDAIIIYGSSQSGGRLDRIEHHFTGFPNSSNIVTIDSATTYQEVLGFGGAITDATGENLESLDMKLRNLIMRNYYGEEGIQYRLTRTPMGSCDFSPNDKTYNDMAGDMDLNNFALLPEDHQFRIPYLKQAQAIAKEYGGDVKLFTTAWSSPGWMKTTGKTKGGGRLLGDVNGPYYKTWTNYYMKFFEAYHKEGVDFWGVTPENEPGAGANDNYGWQALFFNASMQRDWIKGLLGPALRNSPITKDIVLMIGDDDRTVYPQWADVVFGDPEAAKYVQGSAFHWYFDFDGRFPVSIVQQTHDNHPDRFTLYTESCHGGVSLGNWTKGAEYAHSIIENMNHWVTGWVDWNMIVNPQGGPSYISASVDAPIIANATAQEFIKQPMFYAMGHFSKFVKPGYKRTKMIIPNTPNVEGISFVASDGHQRVVVFLNTGTTPQTLSLYDQTTRRYANVLLDAKALITTIWNV